MVARDRVRRLDRNRQTGEAEALVLDALVRPGTRGEVALGLRLPEPDDHFVDAIEDGGDAVGVRELHEEDHRSQAAAAGRVRRVDAHLGADVVEDVLADVEADHLAGHPDRIVDAFAFERHAGELVHPFGAAGDVEHEGRGPLRIGRNQAQRVLGDELFGDETVVTQELAVARHLERAVRARVVAAGRHVELDLVEADHVHDVGDHLELGIVVGLLGDHLVEHEAEHRAVVHAHDHLGLHAGRETRVAGDERCVVRFSERDDEVVAARAEQDRGHAGLELKRDHPVLGLTERRTGAGQHFVQATVERVRSFGAAHVQVELRAHRDRDHGLVQMNGQGLRSRQDLGQHRDDLGRHVPAGDLVAEFHQASGEHLERGQKGGVLGIREHVLHVHHVERQDFLAPRLTRGPFGLGLGRGSGLPSGGVLGGESVLGSERCEQSGRLGSQGECERCDEDHGDGVRLERRWKTVPTSVVSPHSRAFPERMGLEGGRIGSPFGAG